MTPDSLQLAGWLFLKIMTLVAIVIYGIFAAVMVRQEQLMAKVLESSAEPVLRILTIVHLLCAVGVFFIAFAIL
jgi:hypothetical protein